MAAAAARWSRSEQPYATAHRQSRILGGGRPECRGVLGVSDAWAAERAAARFVSALALGVMGAGLAWFAYVDAPISDRVMLSIACAVAAGSVATLVGLWALAITLGTAPADSTAMQRRVRRLLRLALAALAALVLLLAVASVITLNLRGSDAAEDTQATTVSA
jgi:hypothetical protein